MKNQEEIMWVTFEDLRGIFKRHRFSIKSFAFFFSLLFFLFVIVQPPVYEIKASFQQAAKSQDMGSSLKEVFQQYLSLPSENTASSILQSTTLLRQTIADLGLQMHVEEKGLFSSLLSHFVDHFLLFFNYPIKDPDPFSFQNVRFLGEKPVHFYLKPLDESTFAVLSDHKETVGLGKIKEPFTIQNVYFTLADLPKKVEWNRCYLVKIDPWQKTVHTIQKKLQIYPSKVDKNLLLLSCPFPDRHLGAVFINQHMRNYQTFLLRENEKMCQVQGVYLQRRQDELIERLDTALQEHVTYLKENISNDGHIGFSEEISTLSVPRNLYFSKLLNIDLEIQRYSSLVNQKNWTPIAFSPVSNLEEEIQNVEDKIDEVKNYLSSLTEENVDKQQMSLLSDPKNFISSFVRHLHKDLNNPQLKSDVLRSLHYALSHLEQKKKTLEEDLVLKEKGNLRFSDISLEAAKQLVETFSVQQDALEATLREMIFLREQLQDPDFELSSIGSVFSDPVTNELARQTSTFALQLKDDHNRTTRDYERLKETLDTQKKFLSHHLFQSIELTKLRFKLLLDKTAHLRKTILELLQEEKALLLQKLGELNTKMEAIPEKWKRENLLSLQKEVGVRMIEGISQLAETKNISQHLYHVHSKPIDWAVPPLTVKSSFALLFAFAGVFLGVGLGFGYHLCHTLFKGIPLSLSQLKLLGVKVAGGLELSSSPHLFQIEANDLETLRRIAHWTLLDTSNSCCAVILGGGYLDYSFHLSHLFSMRGKKVVLLDYVFDRLVDSEESQGICQYLCQEIEEIPIQKREHYDFIPSGSNRSYTTEWLGTDRFKQMIDHLKTLYDIVLIQTHATLGSTEALLWMDHADRLVVTIKEETKEALDGIEDPIIVLAT